MGETEDYGGGGGIASHGTTHQDGGTDKIAVDGLLGELAAEQKSAWAKVSGKPTTFPVAAHADTHEYEGDDEISVSGLSGELAAEQKSSWTKVSGIPATFPPPFATSAEIVAGTEAAKSCAPDQIAAAKAAGYFGKLVQVQHAVVTAAVSGTTQMPCDDTIPQITEGFEFITCTITPKNAANLLHIIVNTNYGCYDANSGLLSLALFRDAITNALAAVPAGNQAGYGPKTLTHKMVAGTVSEITFRARFGGDFAATLFLNVQPYSPTRAYGGVASTTMTIFEYSP